ncbi:RcnB family protein [Pseudomonas sp. KNUC1026]|uniref:RcnB family protein n=1 Tax=Pseudomonas sp. KNUC1026 TaxID=2893890 RepID=UPI001F3AE975|nr:RcnB family protein [Pseudomonas sp. KNUC1026]UFH50947.1 RcnB family protein [Pseudomonas sp. KNUC1026]
MNSRHLMLTLILSGCMAAAGMPVQAAQPTPADGPEVMPGGLAIEPAQVGARAPDDYTRPSREVRNWKQRGLNAPAIGTQWVEMAGKLVRVNRSDGTVVEVQPGVN